MAMPQSVGIQGRAAQSTPTALIVSTSDDEASRRSQRARQRSKTLGNDSKSQSREWIDADTLSQPRRKNRAATKSSPSKANRNRSSTESLFFPKLARILESGESSLIARPGARGQQSRQLREQNFTHSRRARDEGSAIKHKRSSAKQHRVGSVHRRSEGLPKISPSLLSVLSSITGISGHSSGSNTTITQQSYDRISKVSRSEGFRKRAVSGSETITKGAEVPNVFEYMDPTMDDEQDARSVYSSSSSSSSSHYEHSDAGSSELPDTPSSQSTLASPTVTRSGSVSGSVAELRRKYDVQYASSVDSRRSGSRSPEEGRSPPRSIKKLPKLRDVAESDEGDSDTAPRFGEAVYNAGQTLTSHTHAHAAQLPPPQKPHEDRLQAQEEALRQHVANFQQPHAHHRVDSAYAQHRSRSSSSTRSMDSQRAWAQYLHDTQMQQYRHASPAMQMAYPSPHHINGYVAQIVPPPAPDAPDTKRPTLAGYELLARELSTQKSAVKPMYRRFEYLNHRILLHMQDELQEMEEQLRRVDEIIASMEHPSTDSEDPPPASRRNEKHYGTQWHHQRTELLGRIFLKTKDYNSAVSSFVSMTKDSAVAEAKDITIYRDFLDKKTPIHDLETRFLATENECDLILPSAISPRRSSSTTSLPASVTYAQPVADNNNYLTALAFLPMLPLLLFGIIPTIAGRVVVTVLITTGFALVAASTRLSELLSGKEWAICAAAYVLVSAGIAGCVPEH